MEDTQTVKLQRPPKQKTNEDSIMALCQQYRSKIRLCQLYTLRNSFYYFWACFLTYEIGLNSRFLFMIKLSSVTVLLTDTWLKRYNEDTQPTFLLKRTMNRARDSCSFLIFLKSLPSFSCFSESYSAQRPSPLSLRSYYYPISWKISRYYNYTKI